MNRCKINNKIDKYGCKYYRVKEIHSKNIQIYNNREYAQKIALDKTVSSVVSGFDLLGNEIYVRCYL